jgi:hypothetical protein
MNNKKKMEKKKLKKKKRTLGLHSPGERAVYWLKPWTLETFAGV